ncbi:DUF262 domain-containing protein [Altererythrobacter sp. MTPC7]
MYKPGGTIAAALDKIQRKSYVLPAIQREFVWKPEQIERLFDSLMQGYPFGTFLFWTVKPETSGNFKFYDFVLHYHQRDAAHCPELPTLHDQTVTAVLDGQQRLTALNIGLRGSMAMKLPSKWWTNPDAFPKKTLRLNLLASLEPDEDGIVYDFRFLDDAQVERSEEAFWYNVPDIMAVNDVTDLNDWLVDAGLSGEQFKSAFRMVTKLYHVVKTNQLMYYYEEEAQDVERVLNIFIRLNSGGTVLSYSDLLLSIAVAQWKKVDARSEIHSLVDEINRIGTGFTLSQDFVLKAGLMLSDIASVGFKVENFTQANMEKLESNWPQIRAALVRTVELAASFGLNGQTLRADSALLPIAYYLYHRKAPANYSVSNQFSADREIIHSWLIRSLLKASGIWGSGLDTLLTALREVIQQKGGEAFPAQELEKVMDARGKSLTFSSAEVEDMLSLQYGDKRMFALLSMLFPFVNLRNQFHMDHVFPISRFTTAKLRKAGVAEDRIEELARMANELPNLQLLEGTANTEKRDALPAKWLAAHYPNAGDRTHYCAMHDLGDVPKTLDGFEAFHIERRERLRERIEKVLDVTRG